MTDWLGHLHPVLLHFPFGMLAAVVVLELVAWRRAEPLPRALRRGLYGLTAVSGLAAGATGWVLGHAGEETALIERHEQWGIAFALGLVVLAAAGWRAATGGGWRLGGGRLRGALLALCSVLAVGAGHLGGTLTHGRGFVGEGAPAWFARPTAALDAALLPEVDAADGARPGGAVFALLERSCVECHGPDKQKGKLRLDSVAGLESVIDRGAPLDSELLYRVALPAIHEDVMPPEDPLAAEDIALLLGWVLAGAPMEEVAEEQAAAQAERVSEEQALDALRERSGAWVGEGTGFDVVYAADARAAFIAAAGGPPLRVDFSLGRGALAADALALLAPFAARVQELSLAGRDFGAALEGLPELPQLARLHAERSGATPAQLRALLAAAPAVRYLNLHGTGADDALLDALARRAGLERLVLHDTAVSAAALAAFRAARPDVDVTADLALPAPADRARRILVADAGKRIVALLRERAIGDYELLWELPCPEIHALELTPAGELLLFETADRAVALDPATGARGAQVADARAAAPPVALQLAAGDFLGMELGRVVLVEELPGGTFLVGQRGAGPAEPQLFEIDRAKEVLWTFRDHQRFSDALLYAAVWEGPLRGE